MEWLNEPPQWHHHNGLISMTCAGETDFWRVTRHDFIQHDGHFYWQEVSGDFVMTAKVTGAYHALYDQAGLMIRENDLVWMKCGIEFLHGVQQASAVITRDFSDWSIVPLPDNPTSIWMQVQRIGSTVEVSYSHDGDHYTLIRQAYLTESVTLQAGVMAAAPKGKGFNVTFEALRIDQ